MKTQYRKYLLPLILLTAWAVGSYAQAPSISYSNTQTIVAGTTITPIVPTNTGGAPVANGQTVTFAGSGAGGFADGTGTSASFWFPMGVAVDSANNVFIADPSNNRIRKITPAGVVTTLAGSTPGYADGHGTAARFSSPCSLTIDKSGNLYVADNVNNRIRKVTPTGDVSTVAGSGASAYTDGKGAAASFYRPMGLTVDPIGNVYVADCLNHCIRKITPDGMVTTLAGSTTQTSGTTDGTGTAARFNRPSDLKFDALGNLYVADWYNNTIRKINPLGVVTTFAGSNTTFGSADGLATAATFHNPTGLAIDLAGNLYVCDENSNKIRKITPGAQVTTLAGTGTASTVNGAGNTATFNAPFGIAMDSYGNAYVAEYTSNLIRKVATTPYTISPALPAGLNFDPKTGIISGAAISSSPLTTYTITAYNLSGSSATTLTFAVNAASVSPSQNMNYVITYTPRVPLAATGSAVVSANIDKTQVETNVQYFDGLGRPIQTIQFKGSPNGRDVVQPFIYDSQGRDSVKYLPYAVTGAAGSDGSYKTDALTAGAGVLKFYYPGTGNSGDQQSNGIVVNPNPYSRPIYEPSALNRVIEQGAPGTPWQPVPNSTSGHTVKIAYTLNNATAFSADSINGRQVAWYNASINANGSRTLVANGFYPANTLTVTVTEDENWTSKRAGTTEEYKDTEGHIILKRQYNYTTSLQVLSTYYVYDDFDKLSFVLTPKSGADGGTTISQTTLDNLCYQYRYDERGRLTQKKLPGKGWEYTVYNYIDQPVATQDSLQRAAHNWIISKYDGQGRVVQTGIRNSGTVNITRASLQDTITKITTNLWETPVATGNGYTNAAWPANNVSATLALNYYDSYTNIPGFPTAYSPPAGVSVQTRGLAVAKKTAVLNTPADQLWGVMYYDDLGRVVKTYAQHYLGGTANINNYDAVITSYNFTNAPTQVTRQHFTTASTTVPLLMAVNTYGYDHMGRKLKTWEQLTYSTNLPTGNTLINQVDYNEIGQVLNKHLHSTDSVNFLQNIAYTYNERGWLLTSSAPLFAMQLYYNTGSRQAYNGNILYQYWGTPGSLTKSYSYVYDKLNRFLYNNSSTGNYESNINYDLIGNIASLARYQNSTQIDNLGYTYYANTNQIQSITDNSGNNAGLPNLVTNFTYDGNGNLVSQSNTTNAALNKTINTYNFLNLPQLITVPQGTLTYTYDATGAKMRKVSVLNGATNTTDYISGIQYSNSITAIDFIQTEEGKAAYLPTTGGFDYYYYLGDNLGNTRVTFDTKTLSAAVYQTDDYYPFGKEIITSIPNPKNEYLYNKKELQEELGEYDYGARFYDPVIGRWNVVDPLAEKSRRFSPYTYVENNPIRLIDPDGMEAQGGGCCGIPFITTAPGSPLGKIVQKLADEMGLATGNDVKKLGEKNVSTGEKAAIIGKALQTIAAIFAPEGEVKGGAPPEAPKPATIEPPSVGNRATEIHSAVPKATQTRTTIAVADGVDANGKPVRVVGSSEPRLRPAQRAMLQGNEVEATGQGHAEPTVINFAQNNGITLSEIGASRPICNNCYLNIKQSGVTPTTPLKNPVAQ